MPTAIPIWVGTEYGSRWLSTVTLWRLLAIVLVIAGVKLMFTWASHGGPLPPFRAYPAHPFG